MPRTKQIHPRNLRGLHKFLEESQPDNKIEEAQKELNGAEVSKKEILEAGSLKGTSESLKGVKRKKIVAENHLKKIPKSPLRNPLQAKHKQNTEASSFSVLQSASESPKKQNHSAAKNGKHFTRHNGAAPGMTAEATKLEAPVSPKKPGLPQPPADLHRWRSEGSDAATLNLLGGKCDSSPLLRKTRTDHSECISSNCSPASSLYTNTAFDVLLKAMEPELSTLSQKDSSCAVKIEKLRPNKTARPPSQLKNSSVEAPGQTSQEFVTDSQSSCTSCTVHVPAAQNEQAPVQSISHSYNQHEHFISKPNQPSQQLPVCPGFTRSLTNLQNPENPKLEQVYNTAVTSSVGLTSPSSRTQVTSQNQPMDSASAVAVNPARPTQSPPTPIYSSPPVSISSVVSHSVEQMCNLLLKEQKPKKQGKYICEYCNRACAKPSVLLKHIRSHTGERPYPCVTCGFSFKTKSNLYKHKKSHAHTIKLGLVLQPDAGGLFLAHESPKALSIHSDVEDSGESDDESTADERQNDLGPVELQPGQTTNMMSHAEALPKSSFIPSNADRVVGGLSLQDKSSESQAVTELPKVLVHPVSVSPVRVDSPKLTDSKSELPGAAQKQKDLQVTSALMRSAWTSSLETVEEPRQKGDMSQPEGKQEGLVGAVHAQLQRQQATDYSQEPPGKLLSPRSLGSTDSGYFSRSESADQTVSPPAPFARTVPAAEPDASKIPGPPAARVGPVPLAPPAPPAVPPAEKALLSPGQMRPPLATKTLEERISKLISDNEALVDDKQLDSVKPRRTSLSRRGSIDSPKSYIFKDSFQFDLKPMGRRTSSSSDIPKSPFTPTEKSKPVFLLSVPSLDCLPITRSNSMPTTGYSAVPANIIPPPHPLRGSQSFDDKIGTLSDDVFVSGPNTPVPQSGHPRTLVRQAAVEDSSANENHVLGASLSLDEGHQGLTATSEPVSARSKSSAPGSHLEKKKSHQGRGTMFECETCRNRYRKLENFENHKKFYCSELHGPKTKVAVREPEPSPGAGNPQPQILHYRVAGPPGAWEQPPQIRKRRKMKSVGDDDEFQPSESAASPRDSEGLQFQNALGSAPSLSQHNVVLTSDPQHRNRQLQNSQIQLVARGPEQTMDPKLSTILEQQTSTAAQDKTELKRHGAGISVIQHTNSLSRPSAFDKLESFGKGSSVSFQELSRTVKLIGVSQEGPPPRSTSHPHQPSLPEALRGERPEGFRKMASERHALGQPLRLVRQHNIQVPEILVTEEPDRDPNAQGPDQEKSEKFSWPQRSETLSKLPTEKLPPKKKRLRLAEMEHSSTESSFDSTLSRSLSRESSLSHTSSFSASLDAEDVSKTEASPQIAFLSKTEFLMIPAVSATLDVPGAHREMRRAASEQIDCAQASMEVSDFRSKSFDCGSLSPSQTAPCLELQPPASTSGLGVTGHVPLLERRRGTLIRQISLNIAPESHLSPGSPSSFQTLALPGVNAGPSQGPPLPDAASAEIPTGAGRSQTPIKDLQAETSNSNSTHTVPVQQLFSVNLSNHVQAPLSHQNAQMSLQLPTQAVKADANPSVCGSSESEDCFAPKYQLQCQVLTPSHSCSSNTVHSLPKKVLSDPVGANPHASPSALPTRSVDAMSNPCPPPPLQLRPLGGPVPQAPTSFALPLHLQSNVPVYCFATVTPLPQILVTQDLSCQPACQAGRNVVPISEEQAFLPKLQRAPQNALPNPEGELVCENVFSEMGQNLSCSESLPAPQKMSVGRLSPQQESSASSKRMLSPANSLDIAMEKHQKRAKDEHGAVCATDTRPFEPLNPGASEVHKQKKPVLVRQVCTTEPLEGVVSEQDIFSQPEISSEAIHLVDVLPADHLSTGHAKSVVAEPIREPQEFENMRSSTSLSLTVRHSPVPSGNAQISPLERVDSNQERKSPEVKNQGDTGDIQEQSEPTALPVLDGGEPQQLSFPSLKTTTNFTWCYLLRQKTLHLPQSDQKTSAYTDWTVSTGNPNPLGLPTKVALSLLNSKQKAGKSLYCQAVTTHSKSDVLVYSSKWKSNLSKRALGNQKSTVVEFSNKDASEINSEQDKENSLIKSEPRRIKIFDGGYKSNEEYVYVRGRGRGKYICEECGIRCKKPSMLKKHIRTHTDVRPYHCTYCNFSFKTKGNLTKHMKSKTHSKKCVDLGVSVGLIDEQDTEESDEKQRFSFERSYDLEESDGPDEDDNENEDDDEDSQAESVPSAAPSVTASPQHLPSRSSLQDAVSADEDLSVTHGFSGVHPDPMDVLPRALPTKMTVLSAVHSDYSRKAELPVRTGQRAAKDEDEAVAPVDSCRSSEATLRSPGHHMSVDYPESEESFSSVAGKAVASTQSAPSGSLPPPAADTHAETPPGPLPPTPGLPAPHTHLFSHLPLHSQQQSKAPYSTVPVGGIHVVPAGLTYSTFVPIPAGPMQLTIPAVNVIHGAGGAPGETAPEVPGASPPAGVAGLSRVVPCIPLGQIRVPGLPNLSSPGLQPLPSLSVEAVNLVGLASRSVAPQAPPPGLALNAVGLQVLTASPAPPRSAPAPPAPVPGLQILNIALPALLPAVSRVAVEDPPAPQSRAREGHPAPASAACAAPAPPTPGDKAGKAPDSPAPARDQARLQGCGNAVPGNAASVRPAKPKQEPAPAPRPPGPAVEPALQARPEAPAEPAGWRARPADRPGPRGRPRRQAAPQVSDGSSDDEDRLVIAT